VQNPTRSRTLFQMSARQDDFYQAMRARIASWLKEHGQGYRHAQILLVAPDLFHLLCRLALDVRVPAMQKAKLASAIAYFVSPFDLIPEAVVGPIGYLDDVALAAFVLNSVINSGQGEIAKEHWAGEGDLLPVIQHIIEVADQLLGSGLLRRLKAVFESSE
jgi:uncharacterized membrane protein YkvA (DUF1232 family)